jgi:hypothetical protein
MTGGKRGCFGLVKDVPGVTCLETERTVAGLKKRHDDWAVGTATSLVVPKIH